MTVVQFPPAFPSVVKLAPISVLPHIPMPSGKYAGSLLHKHILAKSLPPEYAKQSPTQVAKTIADRIAILKQETRAYGLAVAFCKANPDWPMDTLVSQLLASYAPLGLTASLAARAIDAHIAQKF